MDTRFVLMATVTIKDGCREAFLLAILENQRCALADEPGCRRFQVLQPQDSENTFVFFEEYDDEEAFKVHQASPHFTAYFEKVKDMFVDRVWQKCGYINDGA